MRVAVPQNDGSVFAFWAAPGGEMEGDEEPAATAMREIREELGLELAMEGPIRVDRNSFVHRGAMVDNTDFYFRAACERDAPRLIGVTAEEIAIMKEIRWWSGEQLEGTEEKVFPLDLRRWIDALQTKR